jgi:riboflavin kinase/FMN adenylyltransferase
MKIYRSLSELPPDLGSTVATIGNFDGVHRGHQWVIAEVIARAKAISQQQSSGILSAAKNARISVEAPTVPQEGVTSLAITLDPHPARVLGKQTSLTLITPLEEKLVLLAKTGIDATLVLPFDLDLSRLTARDFASTILRDALHVTEVHEGENFRFGHNAQADIEGLEQLGRDLNFTVRTYTPSALRGESVSSSRIRALIAAGEVHRARPLLGRPFTILSTPASGRGYGTKYTVPTINLALYAELLPAIGVYITCITVGAGPEAETFQAVTNVGTRPTFGSVPGTPDFTVETHILNFHPVDLTEFTPIRLAFLHRLRPEIKWPNPEALRTQIGLDVARAKRYFSLCTHLTMATPSNESITRSGIQVTK